MTKLPPLRRRTLLQATAGSLAAKALAAAPAAPNIIVILCDDLGSGDLGCYGSRIGTPNIDRVAAEGVAFTDCYSANPLCSPARAAFMTGRYAPRTGVADLLFPTDTTGLPDSEATIPQVLKPAGYRSMCVGKWHLGCQPAYMPLRRGFDEFYGVPYSHDMSPLPLLSNNDAVEEIDWSVGQVMQALRNNGIDDNTLVMFTSDHGPWFQGSAGALRGRKGQTFEGGVRVPLVARFPGRIPAGSVCRGVASTMDILPTAAGLASVPLPAPELYDVVNDPEESYNLAPRHPDLAAAMRVRVESLLPTLPERVRQAWKQTQSLPV